jgi:hypothetical protein
MTKQGPRAYEILRRKPYWIVDRPQVAPISQKYHREECSKACPRAGGGSNLNPRDGRLLRSSENALPGGHFHPLVVGRRPMKGFARNDKSAKIRGSGDFGCA